MELIDLHTHTFFSDGVLSPAELVYRCKLRGHGIAVFMPTAAYNEYKEAKKGK